MMEMEYIPGDKLFKVTERKTKHLEKMGFPRRNLHYLYLEEALYLVQNELAIALFDEKRLSLPHLYQLLGTLNVSLLKYSAFSTLIQAGYSVKRPTAQKFNEVPDVKQLKMIYDEQSDVPLLIASGTPENLRISKFSAQSEKTLNILDL
ncbi:tRNA-splicing endonuclease subunit sen54 n-term domain-containing protein [Ditylenchus destructor]|nr:tRNA-splicing endonuclease subunit sen54 n-term domain-containing protein [Ditylenchus destructor]